MAALSSHYDFKLFTKQEVENGFFETVDAICFGGGFGDSDSFRHLFVNNRDHIRKFVRSGRPYIGICMGGYWAGSHYFGILNACDTTQYITRPGTDTRRPHAKNLEVDWNGRRERMFFYDGFAVTGNERNFETYARFHVPLITNTDVVFNGGDNSVDEHMPIQSLVLSMLLLVSLMLLYQMEMSH